MNTKLKYILFFLFMVLQSCKPNKGSKDFAESIGQCGRIVFYIKEYEKNADRLPSGLELRDFIEDKESESGIHSIQGWTFNEAGSDYIAVKKNIEDQQENHLDIFINLEGEYFIRKSH